CGALESMLRSSTGAGGSSRPLISVPRLANSARHSANGCGFWALPCPWLVAGDAARRCSTSARATPPGALVTTAGVRRSSAVTPVGSAAAGFVATPGCARWLDSGSPGGIGTDSVAGDVACASRSARGGGAADGTGNCGGGTDDDRTLERAGAVADAIDGPRAGFELAVETERGSGRACRAIAGIDCDALGTG